MNNDFIDAIPKLSPDGTKILFQRRLGTNWDIYTVNIDGSDERRLTFTEGFDGAADWSPDRNQIVFRSDREGVPNLFIVNSDGSNPTKIPNTEEGGRPSWSPDGSKILFDSRVTGAFDLYTINTDGTGLTNFTNTPTHELNSNWSNDGTKVVYSSTRNGNSNIYTRNADGTDEVQLTFDLAFDTFPRWSPDGNGIVFDSNRDANFEIYTMNIFGGSPVRLTNDPSSDRIPHWGVAPPPDIDNDGIPNELDELPFIFSDEFRDIPSGGSTFGMISDRGEQNIVISELPNPAGLSIASVFPPNGTLPAIIDVCGGQAVFPLWPGQQVNITCGSVDMEVVSGDVEFTLIADDRSTATALLNEGERLIFESDVFSLESLGGTAEINLVGGDSSTATVSLSENNAITYDPETFTITADPDNQETINVLINGEETTIEPGEGVIVEDTTPPVVTAAFEPIGDIKEDKGRFNVLYDAIDAVDPNPTLTAVIETTALVNPAVKFKVKKHKKLEIDLNKNKVKVEGPDPRGFWAEVQSAGGMAVNDGQEIEMKLKGKHKYKYKFDKMGTLEKIEAPEIILLCTATDAVGNIGTATATPFDPEDGLNKTVASKIESTVPVEYALFQNYPNPFNPETEIRFQIPKSGHVVMRIFNTLGKEIRSLTDAQYVAGFHTIRWDGRDRHGNEVSSGIYFYQLQAGSFSQVKKMALIR